MTVSRSSHRSLGAIAFIAIAPTQYCWANDTTAALTTGGLVFASDPDIEMRSEDLHISQREVAVRYRFFNRAAADRDVTLAFPMPEIDNQEADNIDLPDVDADNFLKFRTTVEGAPVVARIEQKAMLAGQDVTARLKNLRLPLLPSAKKTVAALDALPPAERTKLLDEKLVRADDYDVGKGMEHHLAPEWRLRTTYFWQQNFPANREITIEHRYVPSVGGTVQTALDRPSTLSAEEKTFYAKYCPDKAFLSAVATLTRKLKTPPPEIRIAYVLGTGANWAGPIRDFRLTLDKGDPQALISVCGSGIVKTGPTTFEMHKVDFRPQGDLDVLIIPPPR